MRKFILVALAVSLAACSKSSSDTPNAPRTQTPVSVKGNVIIGQKMALAGGETMRWDGYPGVANTWDLDSDLSLSDGGDDQFDNAFSVYVGSLATSPATFSSLESEYSSLDSFPFDQNYDELTFYGPLAKKADGVVTATVAAADAAWGYTNPLTGTYSAYLYDTADSRISHRVALPSVTGGQTLTLSWNDLAATYEGYMGASDPSVAYQPYFRVAVRSVSGALLTLALPETTSDDTAGVPHTFDLTAYAGTSVEISFEFRSNHGGSFAIVDDVSVVRSDAPGTNLVTNGDFETGDFTGWTVSDNGQPTGIGSGTRPVAGLDVQRFFYAVPGKAWARWADVYTNNTGAPVTADLITYTNLGSDGAGMIYATPGTSGKAITSWDTASGDRDVGLASGSDDVYFQPTPTFGTYTGSDDVFFVHHATIPAGHSIVLVHFIVMNGTNTRLTASDLTATADDIDTTLATLVAHVRSDPQYLRGMSAAQIAAIANW